MVPRHVVVLLLAGWLSGCGSYAIYAPDTTAAFTSPGKQTSASGSPVAETTGSIAAPTDKSETTALNSLFARAAAGRLDDPSPSAVKPVALADAGETAVATASPPASPEKITEPRGRAYLFRGVAGLIYSRGIDKLADRIKRAGIASSVETYLMWRQVADEAIRDYRRDPQPITLIGHSMGGDSALDFAETLNQAGIPVNLLVTYDPSRIADDVPPNVERYINIYQSSNIMGGGNVVQGARFHGHYASYNLKDHDEIVHINIEKADRIQEQLVTKIAQLAQTPAGAQGEAVPIRLEVPAGAAIELWDSGLPVQAHAGDTLKTLAAGYRVPLWALAQINSLPDRAPLDEGQRIVIPRHLAPMPSAVTVARQPGFERLAAPRMWGDVN
jgi:pimeloyl-ACP methyl ester carboxylesterase